MLRRNVGLVCREDESVGPASGALQESGAIIDAEAGRAEAGSTGDLAAKVEVANLVEGVTV